MFERYTEQARRVIFFARYETSQFGSQLMEPEHLLLGLFREDPVLMNGFFPGTTAELIRERIQRETPSRPKISTSIDLPLSHSAKRVLALGAEEADRMEHRHIRTEHLLLGLLREPSLAARILGSLGVTVESAREQIATPGATPDLQPITPEEASSEREALRSMIESLPEDALKRARRMLDHFMKFPGHQAGFERPQIEKMRQWMRERRGQVGLGFVAAGPGGGWPQEGHFFSSSMENGTLIFETRRVHRSHQITLIERLRVSQDGKTLHYSQELRGPKGEHSWSKDFDIS